MSDSDTDQSLDSETSDSDCGYTLERVDPTSVRDHFLVYAVGPPSFDHGKAYGKWLVFRPLEEIDEMWREVRNAVEKGELGSEAVCTTFKYHPSSSGPGPVRNANIAVYTTTENMDEVGFKLIKMVKHDIRYKTEEATLSGVYVHTGAKRTTIKTLYWNDGEPSEDLKGDTCPGPGSPYRLVPEEDRWQLNRAKAPEAILSSAEVYGKWMIRVEYDELTPLWHFLREPIESGKLGAIEMVCPPKRDLHDPNELPQFHIYTTEDTKDDIGLKLIRVVKTNLVYKVEQRDPESQLDWRGPQEQGRYRESRPDAKNVHTREHGRSYIYGSQQSDEGNPRYGRRSREDERRYYGSQPDERVPREQGRKYMYSSEAVRRDTDPDPISKEDVRHYDSQLPYERAPIGKDQGNRYKYTSQSDEREQGRRSESRTQSGSYSREDERSDETQSDESVPREKGERFREEHRGPESQARSPQGQERSYALRPGGASLNYQRSDCHRPNDRTTREHGRRYESRPGRRDPQRSRSYEPQHDSWGSQARGQGYGRISYMYQQQRYTTLYWNDGKPSYKSTKTVRHQIPRTRETKDGQQMYAKAPAAIFSSATVHGRWMIHVTTEEEFAELWETVKEQVECGTLGAIEMISPPKRHHKELPQIHVFTSQDRKDSVGFKLIHIVKVDLRYGLDTTARDPWRDWRNSESTRNNTLYWNNGEPAYEVATRPGITRNWRTGEKMA